MGAVAVPGTEAEGQDMGRQLSDIKRLLVESGHSLLLQRVEGIGVARSEWTPINALAVMSSRLQDVPVDPFGVSPISCAAGLPDDGVGLSCGDIYQAIRRQW